MRPMVFGIVGASGLHTVEIARECHLSLGLESPCSGPVTGHGAPKKGVRLEGKNNLKSRIRYIQIK